MTQVQTPEWYKSLGQYTLLLTLPTKHCATVAPDKTPDSHSCSMGLVWGVCPQALVGPGKNHTFVGRYKLPLGQAHVCLAEW
jgi:hypothetical protein